ncbi:hypothetical protein Tco_0084540 [Tanacetum coccineum]
MHAPEEANIRIAEERETVACNQRIKAKQWEGSAKSKQKRETSSKDKALEILMVQPWQRVARQRITQSFLPNPEISFPPLEEEEASEILYEHCFNRLRPEIRNQMVPATAPLIGFSGEIIWPLGQLSLLVKIEDEEHSTSAWMNFVVVRSSSPYNGIIGRPGVRKIQAVPSTAHGMIKFHVTGGVLTLKSSKIIPIECSAVSDSQDQRNNLQLPIKPHKKELR